MKILFRYRSAPAEFVTLNRWLLEDYDVGASIVLSTPELGPITLRVVVKRYDPKTREAIVQWRDQLRAIDVDRLSDFYEITSQ